MLRLIVPALLLAGCAVPDQGPRLPMPVSQAQMMQCSLRADMSATAERNVFMQAALSNQFTNRCVAAAALENVDDLGRLIGMRIELGQQFDARGRATLLGLADGCGVEPRIIQGLQAEIPTGDAPLIGRGRGLAPQASAGTCAVARTAIMGAAQQRGLWP